LTALLLITDYFELTVGIRFMKQALLILSVLGMGIAQTSGAAITISQTNNTITNTSSNDEISQAISNLSAQAQQKEKQLSLSSSRLYAERQQQQVNTIPDSNSAPAIAAARASKVALSGSSGYCARYVRKALQSAGYEFTPNPSAYQYATRGTLEKAGFSKISNDMPTQVGDVIVYDRSSKRPHGHIQIFDGTNWISDFRQNSISPYSGVYAYTTWRDSKYVDDASASDRNIYLAMNDK